MPALNWDAFAKLPGSAEKNFELLCRGAVRHNFGSFGVLRALANQPGVEFHLKLDESCKALGDPGRWWGWQCRWYDLPSSGELGSTRRKKIEEAIRKTEVHLPGLTDWVLWTRRTLTSGDQKWFSSISSKMRLQLWTGDEIENLLIGQAFVLRSTYFGELIFTPDMLRERHELAIAPIRKRWQPDVHHVLEAERELRKMLGESDSWDALRTLAADLLSQSQAVEDAPTLPPALAPAAARVVETSKASAESLVRLADAIRGGDLDLLRGELSSHPRVLVSEVATAPRRLRSGNWPAALWVTNAVAGCRETLQLLEHVEAAFSSRIVAVVAPAGCGKTHLAAHITVGTQARPAGVLLHGRDLHANQTLDDLAKRVLIAAQPVPSVEALLAAVDAAGQRAGQRLPLVIDGLNESEDPRVWKPLLAALESTLEKYPYVLVICTLRPEFVEEALPDDTRRVEIEGYGTETETIEAIRQHFRYYKIDPADASLPLWLLKHPLTLRLFCEVTNPRRERRVGVDAMPGSLTALFDRYLDQVGDRIAELAPRIQRYYAQDVRAALGAIGNALWEKRTRALDVDELRRALRDEGRPWDQSLVRALEHEGVLLRMPSDGNGAYVPVYDRLGGHLVAQALLSKHGQNGFEALGREAATTALLSGGYEDRHPLADDVVYSLAGQIPRRLPGKQLWQLVEEPLRSRALRFSADLEAGYLDAVTVEALLDLVRQGDSKLLGKVWRMRGVPSHPLNAEALDGVLRPMAVAERDLAWTEWLRKNHEDVLEDHEQLEGGWRKRGTRPADRLRARWVMWTLTSTVRRLRDEATRALYWFGRADPEGLFDLTIESLAINDAYVSERMLAAAYGVAMSQQQPSADFAGALEAFLSRLASALVAPTATMPVAHYLARVYVRGIVSFATKFYASVVPQALRGAWSFGEPVPVAAIAAGDEQAEEVGRTLHMDFENYTLGRLFEDRRNYDMARGGHQAAVAHVLGVVWSLGWRAEAFEKLDHDIAEAAFRAEGRGRRALAERYGKKYGWIGFFRYAAKLEAQGLLPHDGRRLSEVDIDPSFPEPPPVDGMPVVRAAWLSPKVASHERWMREGRIEIPRQILVRERIREHQGPWIAVHGFLKASDRILGREVWAFLSALVTRKRDAPFLEATLATGEPPWVARDTPADHYTFAGEIPWHPEFGSETSADAAEPEYAYRERVRDGRRTVDVESLAHEYGWESYHSEMNQAGSPRVPSRCFSRRFDLRSVPQGFDQVLPDGTRATITLSGVDGLDGDVLYVREDLLRQYVKRRAVLWFAFGERELHPYPRSPSKWLIEAQRDHSNAWRAVLSEHDLKLRKGEPTGRKGRKAG